MKYKKSTSTLNTEMWFTREKKLFPYSHLRCSYIFFCKENDVDGDIRLKDMKSIHALRAQKKIYFRDNYPVNHHLEYIWRDIQIISCMDNFPLIIFDFALSRNCYYIFISWENTSIIQLNSYNIKFRSDIFKFCLTPKLLLYFHL